MRWKWKTRLEKVRQQRERREAWRQVFALTPQYDIKNQFAYWGEWVWVRTYDQDGDGLFPWVTEVRGGCEKPEDTPLPNRRR